MKKIILTLALVAFAFSANAQWVLGGNVAFDHTGNATGNYYNQASTSYSLMPKVGYWLNDRMQLGVQFGVGYNYHRDYRGDHNNDHYRSTSYHYWQFSPYFRYNVAKWNRFTVFAEAQLGMQFSPKSKWHDNTAGNDGTGYTKSSRVAFTIVPGLNYALTGHLSLDAYVDLLGLYYNYTTLSVTSVVDNTETITTTHNYGLMADMDPQPLLFAGVNDDALTGHLTLVRIGFNYSF